MSISSNLNTLRSMIRDLELARSRLHANEITADEYFTQLCGVYNRFRLEQRMESGLLSGDYYEIEKEADALQSHLAVVQAYRNSTCFQGGDFDLYIDLQNPGGLPSRTGWGVL